MTNWHRTPDGIIKKCHAKTPETCRYGGIHFNNIDEANKYNDLMNKALIGKSKEIAFPTNFYSNKDFLKLSPPLTQEEAPTDEAKEMNKEREEWYKRLREEIESRSTKENLDLTTDEILGISKIDNIDFNFIDNNNSNPNKNLMSGESRSNCQICSLAFELRCRGYDVEAKGYGSSESVELSRRPQKAYINPETGVYPEPDEVVGDNAKQLYKNLNKMVKPGARYILEVNWRAKNYGHVVNIYKNKEGDLILFDAQNNEVSVNEQIGEYLKKVKITYTYKGSKEKHYWTHLTRVDNLELNPYFGKKILKINK